ncbi:MAG: helix-turn-helix domain-containing protein [Pseudonocardia sp.]|nr:helix-turn-helix domain-containing protein [Pseudonocardia sp.]
MAGRVELPADDVAELLRAVRSRQTPRGVAARAQIVLDCADGGIAEAARRASVSRPTAAKWWKRYQEGGVAALDDVPRAGRPAADDEMVRRILGCSLVEPPPGANWWTTRAVAQAVGVSQATVSRVRRRFFPHSARSELYPVGYRSMSIISYVGVHPSGCALGFHAASAAPARDAASRPIHVGVIETIVCASLLRASRPGPDALDVLCRAAEQLPSTTTVELVIDVELDEKARRWLLARPWITAHSLPGDSWFSMMHGVAGMVDPRQIDELREVQRRIRAARSGSAGTFVWPRGPAHPAATEEPGPPAAVDLLARSDVARVVRSICAAVADGELQAGDVISPRRIARRCGLTPGHVTETLSHMAQDALVERVDGQYRLPDPAPSDVVDTYTARGLLGTAVVRNLASARIELMPTVDEHHRGLVRCNEQGLMAESHRIDLDFQDELARSCRMPRIGAMFIRLSLQLRLFVAILGLRYRYPPHESLAEADRLLVAIRRNDPAAAVVAWHDKIDNCAHYMLGQLPSDRMNRAVTARARPDVPTGRGSG